MRGILFTKFCCWILYRISIVSSLWSAQWSYCHNMLVSSWCHWLILFLSVPSQRNKILVASFSEFSVSLHLHRVLTTSSAEHLRVCLLVKLRLLRWVQSLDGNFLRIWWSRLIQWNSFSSSRIWFACTAIATIRNLKRRVFVFLFWRLKCLTKHIIWWWIDAWGLLQSGPW